MRSNSATRDDVNLARELVKKYWSRRRLCSGNYLKAIIRDNGKCRKCGTDVGIEVHHIDKNRKNDAVSNLITLCEWCYKKAL